MKVTPIKPVIHFPKQLPRQKKEKEKKKNEQTKDGDYRNGCSRIYGKSIIP
jgi:hypothetical protein